MIRSSSEGQVRVVTIDRPERRNALTPAGLDELSSVIDEADEPVVYLRGAGEAFCSGADLDVVRNLDREQAIEFAEHGQRVARDIEEYDGAVVAGIDGPARGGGVELALACDLRIGTPAATLAESGVSLGLFGAWGGTARLPEVVGQGVALDIALSGRVLSADEACEVGLLSRVVENPRRVAEEIAENDASALAVIKERIRDTSPRETQERREAEAFGDLVEGCDFEAVLGEE
jgi:enoyl-CoA hydratase/carnithine racemase